MYKESSKGKAFIELFNPERDRDDILAESFFKWQQQNDAKEKFENLLAQFILIAENAEYQNLSLVGEDGKAIFETFIDNIELKDLTETSDGRIYFGKTLIKKDDYRGKLNILSAISVYLYLHYEFYKPILFQHNFSVIQRACEILGINVPVVPRTNNHRQYLLYYYDICEAFNVFQHQNDMTDPEFCACLYGYAPMEDDRQEAHSELPSPTNVWLTGASKYDIESIVKNGMSESVWACNERTRRGDIVVLYAKSPYSQIHSIWRASSNGIFNPFDYYHCRTTVKDGQIIPPISSQELKSHPYLSQLPIVKNNMQGVNGIDLSAQDYRELSKLIIEKGGDAEKLPKLFEPTGYIAPNISVEKDVEEKIFIPFLKKLGYAESDYTRQLSMKTGRGKSAIPDFVFFPSGEKHFERSPFVAEAKLKISTISEFNDTFEQAYSYANLLRSSLMAIFDKDRLILYDTANGMPNRDNPVFEKHWAVIFADSLIGAQLNKLIGREAVKNM